MPECSLSRLSKEMSKRTAEHTNTLGDSFLRPLCGKKRVVLFWVKKSPLKCQTIYVRMVS
nr:MAG TPA: hypothetical protein [Caudoviricetes sp.]